jgi:hypothetical protein
MTHIEGNDDILEHFSLDATQGNRRVLTQGVLTDSQANLHIHQLTIFKTFQGVD